MDPELHIQLHETEPCGKNRCRSSGIGISLLAKKSEIESLLCSWKAPSDLSEANSIHFPLYSQAELDAAVEQCKREMYSKFESVSESYRESTITDHQPKTQMIEFQENQERIKDLNDQIKVSVVSLCMFFTYLLQSLSESLVKLQREKENSDSILQVSQSIAIEVTDRVNILEQKLLAAETNLSSTSKQVNQTFFFEINYVCIKGFTT